MSFRPNASNNPKNPTLNLRNLSFLRPLNPGQQTQQAIHSYPRDATTQQWNTRPAGAHCGPPAGMTYSTKPDTPPPPQIAPPEFANHQTAKNAQSVRDRI